MLYRAAWFGPLSLFASSALSQSSPGILADVKLYSPFDSPFRQDQPIYLFKRQGCPGDHSSCSNLDAPDACCPSGTNCARDQQGNVACCPVNNVCTGVLGGSPGATTTGAEPSRGTTGFAGTVTVTSTAGVTGGSPTTPASITGSVEGGGSTLQNAYYPFVYLPTSFGNAGICSQYYTSCQTASTACFQSLGGINGVTINGLGGGTTQVGNSGIVQASASSICSSLSQEACRGLQSTQCTQFGSTGGIASGFTQIGRGPRETGRAPMMYVAVMGAAAGAMGIVIQM